MELNKKTFLLFSLFLISATIFEIILIKNPNSKMVANFVKITTFYNPSFYINNPHLRHRDLNNINAIFEYSPSLREKEIGSFILKAPIK